MCNATVRAEITRFSRERGEGLFGVSRESKRGNEACEGKEGNKKREIRGLATSSRSLDSIGVRVTGDKLMPRLLHVKRSERVGVCNNAGRGGWRSRCTRQAKEKEKKEAGKKGGKKREGEVPVQLHSFTFPAGMSHT